METTFRKEYKLLLAASLLVNFGDNLIGPMYIVFVQEIGATILEIGYAATIFSITMGLFIILIGKISDKLDKELITLIGYSLFAIGTLFYLLVSSMWHLYLLQIIFALASALLSAPLTALMSQFISKETSGFQWGLEAGGGRIAVGIAVMIGAFIVNFFGFTTLFLIMFTIQILATLVQLKFYLRK